MLAALLFTLQLGICEPPDNLWQVVVHYKDPITSKDMISPPEPICGEKLAIARKQQIINEGYNYRPMSWEINWVAPAYLRGFTVTAWVF